MSSQKERQRNGDLPLLSEMFPGLRKGKWTVEEEEYTNKMITYFNLGLLRVIQGTTLRAYLSDKLYCDPMRITKKFTGDECIGKQVFTTPVHDEKSLRKCEAEMKKLERLFIIRLVNKSKERPRRAKRALTLQRANSEGKSSHALNHNQIHLTASPSIPFPLPQNLAPHVPPPPSTDPVSGVAVGKKGIRKRVNSAPDLVSLELFEKGRRQAVNNNGDGQTQPKKKQKKGGLTLSRSRSMLSFESFAEIDDRAAGELLLSFSETLRNNFLELQKKTAASAIVSTSTTLPAFFSSEATSSEAAKYHWDFTQSSKSTKPKKSSNTNKKPFIENRNFASVEERVPFSAFTAGYTVPSTVNNNSNTLEMLGKKFGFSSGEVANGTMNEPVYLVGSGAYIE